LIEVKNILIKNTYDNNNKLSLYLKYCNTEIFKKKKKKKKNIKKKKKKKKIILLIIESFE